MRITRETLLNLAREHSAKLSSKDRGLVCVYLTGSLLKDDPFIGGITDIDLVCVHDRTVSVPREIVRINADVHLDIAHYTQESFAPARKLRLDPWIGGALESAALSLQDSTHWFDLTRSTAVSQFLQPANVAGRSQKFLGLARQNWQALVDGTIPQGIKRVLALLDVVRFTANAVAVLNGMPLPLRRMFIDLPGRATAAGLPNLTGELVGAFTSEDVTDEHWAPWMTGLGAAFESLANLPTFPASIHPNRRNYFEKAIHSLQEERPAAAVWILLDVWTMAAAALPKADPVYKEWQTLCHTLRLESKHFPTRLEALDSALDQVEEVVDHFSS
jgi:hypothetical protein